MEFLEPQVRQLYRILGHGECGGFSDVRCIIPKESPLEQDKEFQDRLKSFRETNEREPDDKELRDLHVVSRIILKGKKMLSSGPKNTTGVGIVILDGPPGHPMVLCSNLERSLRILTLIENAVQSASPAALCPRYPGSSAGTAALSRGLSAAPGNGALLVYRLPSPITTDFKPFEQRFKAFEEEMRKDLCEGVTLDATFDTARMVKLLGTVSTKGNREIGESARFIDFPCVPYATEPVLERIKAHRAGAQVTGSTPIKGTTFEKTFIESRSESDFGLACSL